MAANLLPLWSALGIGTMQVYHVYLPVFQGVFSEILKAHNTTKKSQYRNQINVHSNVLYESLREVMVRVGFFLLSFVLHGGVNSKLSMI